MVFKFSTILFLSFLALTTISMPVFAGDESSSDDSLPNLATVHPGKVFRGGQPNAEGFQHLQQMGVKTVVKLNKDDLAEEQATLASLGIQLVYVPLRANFLSLFFPSVPSDEDMKKIDDAIVAPENQPVYVHCMHGQDRTGLVIGIYRYLHGGFTAAAAYAEMESLGFHSMFRGLVQYFTKVTGYNPDDHELGILAN